MDKLTSGLNINDLLRQGQSIESFIDSIGFGQLFVLKTKVRERYNKLFLEKLEGYNFVSHSPQGGKLMLSFSDFISLLSWDTIMLFIDNREEFERYMTIEEL